MSNKISAKLTLFVIALKNNNTQGGITFDDFISQIKTINKARISRYQFLKIIQQFNSQGFSFDSNELFKELAKDEDRILIATLREYYIRLSKMSNQRVETQFVKEKEYKEQLQNVEKKMRAVQTGFDVLLKFMQGNEVTQIIFDDCDTDRSGDVDETELNKFLIASEIEEFKDKFVRKQLIEDIFNRFKTKRLKKQDFFNLFKITMNKKYSSSKKNISNPEETSVSLQQNKKKNNIRINVKKKAQNKPQTKVQIKQNTQTLVSPKLPPVVPPNKNENSYPPKQVINENLNKNKDLGTVMQFYRHGNPPSPDLIYLEELSILLANNQIYQDKNNPKIQGEYANASTIFKQGYQLFSLSASAINRTRGKYDIAQYIQAKDIKQGSVGDCYFLSAISSLAHLYPELLSQRFLFEVNPAKYNCVKLFVDGQWKYVVTDDSFAFKNGQILYAKPNQSQIWVMLLEKAFAKIYGSYSAIQMGLMSEAFFLLTGAPQETLLYENEEKQSIIRKIFESTSNGYILGATGNKHLAGLKQAEEQLGLVANHAYSLLSIHKIREEVVLRLRNPWGYLVWKGAWSQDSKEWTPELKKQYRIQQNPNDGTFFMSWKDFQKYFWTVTICKLNPMYQHTSLKMVNNKRKSNYISMKVTAKGTYNIFICQENSRKSNNKNNPSGYSSMRLIIAKRHENGYLQYIESQNVQQDQFCAVEVSLQKGVYVLSAKVIWKIGDNRQCFLTSYGTQTVKFQSNFDRKAMAIKFKQDLVSSFAESMKSKATVKTYDAYGFANVMQHLYFDLIRGIGFIKITNKASKEFRNQKTFVMNGMKVIKPKTSPYEFKVSPGGEDVIGFFLSASGYSYSISEMIWPA